MAVNWKKIIVSGSSAELNDISASGGILATGTVVGSNLSGTNTGDQTLTGLPYAASLGGDDNYVTDAQVTILGNTSGTNTGDQALGPYMLSTATSSMVDLTVTGATILNGSLTVNGTTTTIASTTVEVADQFTFHGSGSDAPGNNRDGGIVVQSGSDALSGSAIYHDIDNARWAVAKSVGSSETIIEDSNKNGFVVTVKSVGLSGLAPHDPSNIGLVGTEASASYGVGEIIIDSGTNGDIWILSAV